MKTGFSKRVKITVLLALMLAAAGTGADRLDGDVGREYLVHEAGRVFLNLPGNGSLGVSRFNEGRLGISWPGPDGGEFLGAGGMYLRFLVDGESTFNLVEPGSFAPIGTVFKRRKLHEGCEGGKRYPSGECDDDGDEQIDEDPYDGTDNDGDGLVDEDFAAIGNEMIVTRAVESSMGLILNQCSYAWSYGHVRDFIGFTTTVEYPADREGTKPDIVNLEAAMYLDFEIGDRSNVRRGEDDRFFFIHGTDAADELVPGFAAVSGVVPRDVFAAVIVLGSRGPDGGTLGVKCFIVQPVENGNEIWNLRSTSSERGEQALGLVIIPDAKVGLDASGSNEYRPPKDGRNSPGEEVEGNFAVLHMLGIIPRLKPGERFEIEWALVFGRSEEVLLRNVQRAWETYSGIEDDPGGVCRWVVPARKAVRRECDVKLVAIWTHGGRQPAAAIFLPPDLRAEEVEWLKTGSDRTALYEREETKILLPLANELVEREEPFNVEGQLTDGTIFTARLGRDLLRTYNADDDLPPGRLPDDSMHLFPNPFLTILNIGIQVQRPSMLLDGETGVEADGFSSVRIYDVKGRLVRTILEEEFLHPGNYEASWDGLDEYGTEVAPGVYYCKLQIGARSLTKRVILLK